MVFDASQDSGIMQDTRYMCRWSMRTDGMMANGAPFELHQTGMLAAEFAEDGAKLRHVELTTDVMSFMQQLRRSTGRDVFQVRLLDVFFILPNWSREFRSPNLIVQIPSSICLFPYHYTIYLLSVIPLFFS